MSYSSHTVNEKGEVMCANCRKKFKLLQVDSCGYCGRFVCKKCASKKQDYLFVKIVIDKIKKRLTSR